MIKVAIMGHGTVGSGVYEVFDMNADKIAKTVGEPVEVKYVLDLRDFSSLPYGNKFVTDFSVIENDPEVTVVAEVMGGVGAAYQFTKRCLEAGKSVCTSNKELVATKGEELLKIAEEHGVNYMFEASVGGGIPVIRPMLQCLAANEFNEICGILNGTTNYILTQMIHNGVTFADALKQAQLNGYAEKDPTADIEGHDACRKICILSDLAYGDKFDPDQVSCEGITKITADDIAAATAENKVIKLLAVVENGEAGVSARVYPALISNEHPLASVHGSFNAVFVKAEAADDLMFYGRGAGGAPTASAVVGDVVTEARHIAQGCTGPTIPLYKDLKKAPIEASKAEFAVRFVIHDNPGVLAAIAAKFAEHGVSINGVNQDLKPTLKDPGYDGELQQLRLVTHMTDELTLRETVKDVCALDCVVGEPSILRVLN